MRPSDWGIEDRGNSWRVKVRIGKAGPDQLRDQRSFPKDPMIGKEQARAWRDETERQLKKLADARDNARREFGDTIRKQGQRVNGFRPLRAAATLDTDIHDRLPKLTGSNQSNLRAWLTVIVDGIQLATLNRLAITRQHIVKTIKYWQQAPGIADVTSTEPVIRRVRVASYERHGQTMHGYERQAPCTSGKAVAARTIRNRIAALRDLYHDLDGDLAPTPCDKLGRKNLPAAPAGDPVPLPVAIIIAVGQKLADLATPRVLVKRYRTDDQRDAAIARERLRAADYAKTYARYCVLVATGQRPCSLMRAIPEHVILDGDQPFWYLGPAKNAGAHGVLLNDDMVAAWRLFIAANAWGPYDATTHANRVHAAGWPHGIRPYNAKHSVANDALDDDAVGLSNIQAHFGHTTPTTTNRFYARLKARKQFAVSKALEGRLSAMFKLRVVK